MKKLIDIGRAISRGPSIAIALLVVSSSAFASKPYIDPVQQKQQLERKELVKKSCPATPFAKYTKCSKQIIEDWNRDHPLRGSDEYCEANYRNLSEAQAKTKVEELKKLAQVARPTSAEKEPGEVWSGDLESEIDWIRVKILHAKLLDTRVYK